MVFRLKERHTEVSLQTICGLFGYSRQAYYKRLKVNAENGIEADVVLHMIKDYRRLMPRIGGYKLHDMINKTGHRISRVDVFNILRNNNLLIRRKGRYVVTTNSNHWLKKHPNLIRGFNFDAPNQLWVSDITYIAIGKSYAYLSLITDAYSHRIVGHCLYPTLETGGPLSALTKAIEATPAHQRQGLIHHSDRGLQYCSGQYVDKLNRNGIRISMTEKGDPYENAVAERVNGILKSEWIDLESFDSFDHAAKRIDRIIHIYNTVRPHASCDMLTPQQAGLMKGTLKKRWKKKKYPSKIANYAYP
jgi:transposase InsO family protein